jgi:hypothetical protein
VSLLSLFSLGYPFALPVCRAHIVNRAVYYYICSLYSQSLFLILSLHSPVYRKLIDNSEHMCICLLFLFDMLFFSSMYISHSFCSLSSIILIRIQQWHPCFLLTDRQMFPLHLLINVANGNVAFKQLTHYRNNSEIIFRSFLFLYIVYLFDFLFTWSYATQQKLEPRGTSSLSVLYRHWKGDTIDTWCRVSNIIACDDCDVLLAHLSSIKYEWNLGNKRKHRVVNEKYK